MTFYTVSWFNNNWLQNVSLNPHVLFANWWIISDLITYIFPRSLPFCDWIIRKLCFCCSFCHRPSRNNPSRASEYTTMTETMTMSRKNSSFQHPMSTHRAGKSLLKQVSGASEPDRRKGVLFQDIAVTNNFGNTRV